MKTYKISDIINSKNAVTHKFGIEVYDVISKLFSENIPVSLSFEGLRNVTSGFANASIGKLYIEFPNANQLLILEGVEKKAIWKSKVDNAIYLATNQEEIKLQDSAISELLTS